MPTLKEEDGYFRILYNKLKLKLNLKLDKLMSENNNKKEIKKRVNLEYYYNKILKAQWIRHLRKQ